MAEPIEGAAPEVVEEAPDRKETLEQQFEELEREQAEAPADRPRGPDGKFAPKDKLTLTAKPAAIDPAAPPVEEPAWKKPPQSWKKDYHDAWTKADPRLQEYAFQREEQMRKGIEPLLPKAQLADAIQKAAEPYMGNVRALGIDLPTAVRGLMDADHRLRNSNPQEKLEFFARLATQYGVDFRAVAGVAPQATPQNAEIVALKNELAQLKGEVTTFKSSREEQENANLLQQIQEFGHNKDHFEELRPRMAQLLQSGLATTLQEAYDQAIRLDPELFAAQQAALQAEAESTRRQNANLAAKAARSAAVSVKSSTPGTPTATKAQGRRAMLAEQFDSIEGRL